MPLEWAVILPPWVETTLTWDWISFRVYLLHLLAGLAWGRLVFKLKRKDSMKKNNPFSALSHSVILPKRSNYLLKGDIIN